MTIFTFPVKSCKPFLISLLGYAFIMVLAYSCGKSENSPAANEEMNLWVKEITIEQIHKDYLSGKYTVTDLVTAYLERIRTIDQSGLKLNSVIQLNPDAIHIARESDSLLKSGKLCGPLHGIPVLLKDNIDTHDRMPCTAGSRALKNSYPLTDSYLVKRLREEGAIILGKTNLSEWANFRGQLSTSGWSGLGGQTHNPYDTARNPCGSSSGSAVAVSANLTVLAIATETDGSIVCPSHNNGIVGIKPTVGLVSRSGVIPISFTQDTPGPMARTVRDAAICLGAITGVDTTDSKSLASRGKMYSDYSVFLKAEGLKGKRIGFYTGFNGINFKIDRLMNAAVEDISKAGAEIIMIDRITNPEADKYSFTVMLFEYKDGLNKYFASLGPEAPVKSIDDLIQFNLDDSVELKYFDQKYLIMAREKGGLDSPEYLQALERMNSLSREKGIDRVMTEYNLDAIIAPTGGPAWKTDLVNGDSYQFGSSSFAAQSGYPNITVPMGFIEGLPAGISFFGRAWSEPLLIEIAYGYEQATLHRKDPF